MSFEPQNPLEQSLMKAATDPTSRPQFLQDLVASDIYIIQEGVPPPQKGEYKQLIQDTEIKIRNIEVGEKLYIPFYSSLDRLRVMLRGEATSIRINALAFFKITKGAALILNPGSDYGKEFFPEEVAAIINGAIWQPREPIIFDRATKVLIGQPKNYPKELTEVVGRLFATMPEVKRAWIADYDNPASGEKPHTLMAIEHSGDWASIVGQIEIVTNGMTIADPPMDMMAITGKGGIEDYFLAVEPFYSKKV